MPITPTFTDDEQEMLLQAVADRVANLQTAIRKRSQTHLNMEARLKQWQEIHRKLGGGPLT